MLLMVLSTYFHSTRFLSGKLILTYGHTFVKYSLLDWIPEPVEWNCLQRSWWKDHFMIHHSLMVHFLMVSKASTWNILLKNSWERNDWWIRKWNCCKMSINCSLACSGLEHCLEICNYDYSIEWFWYLIKSFVGLIFYQRYHILG